METRVRISKDTEPPRPEGANVRVIDPAGHEVIDTIDPVRQVGQNRWAHAEEVAELKEQIATLQGQIETLDAALAALKKLMEDGLELGRRIVDGDPEEPLSDIPPPPPTDPGAGYEPGG